MKILVTGSSGTIGTHLCKKLIDEGHNVTGVDQKINKWDKAVNDVTIIQDLRNLEEVLNNLPTGFEAVIHLAANARVHNLVVDPTLARDNFITTFNTLEFCRKNDVPHTVFASSREVYGNSGKVVHTEDDASIKLCASPYTSSKIGGEALVHSYRRCYGMNTVVVRFSNVYGMYDESDRVVPLFIKKCLLGENLTIYGEDKLLDFTYIDDAVAGVLKVLNKFEDVNGQTFNLAFSEGSSLVDVAKQIKLLTNGDSNILIEPNRVGEVVKYVADISNARKHLSYEPKTSVQEGIDKSVEWYLKHLYTDITSSFQTDKSTTKV